MFIPIHQAASTASACSTGEVTLVSGSCSAASTCASGSSCSSGGGASADSEDPSVKLAQNGWILRTTIGEPRLSEVVENYRAMGYEVHVEQFAEMRSIKSISGEVESCTTCYDAADKSDASQAWGSIYVRPGHTVEPNEELF
ncbi:hypothetical protein [Polaromonas sp.]|uniref:hypothetical protein n=1 Tax=Polaromonas sp. TaxID=1869339 RepID=UPI001790E481|nr:hypothetical protein [Polaromonas sp.]NMM05641.1 hypothetical protein [Polaromonas sp.]